MFARRRRSRQRRHASGWMPQPSQRPDEGSRPSGRRRLRELGAEGADGKALLIHKGGQCAAILEEVTEDVFTLRTKYMAKDLVRIIVVYATPGKSSVGRLAPSYSWGTSIRTR